MVSRRSLARRDDAPIRRTRKEQQQYDQSVAEIVDEVYLAELQVKGAAAVNRVSQEELAHTDNLRQNLAADNPPLNMQLSGLQNGLYRKYVAINQDLYEEF